MPWHACMLRPGLRVESRTRLNPRVFFSCSAAAEVRSIYRRVCLVTIYIVLAFIRCTFHQGGSIFPSPTIWATSHRYRRHDHRCRL